MITPYLQYELIISGINRGIYKNIGEGSSRDVFDLNNGYVVKIAKNQAGIEQNITEVNISNNDKTGLFARIVQSSLDYKFIIMQKAKKIRDISYVWIYFGVNSKKDFFNVFEIWYMRQKYNLLFGDINKTSSWGIINNQPVVIDYGFTKRVRDKYYN